MLLVVLSADTPRSEAYHEKAVWNVYRCGRRTAGDLGQHGGRLLLGAARNACCRTCCAPVAQQCCTVMKTCQQVVYQQKQYTCYRTCYEPVWEQKTVTAVRVCARNSVSPVRRDRLPPGLRRRPSERSVVRSASRSRSCGQREFARATGKCGKWSRASGIHAIRAPGGENHQAVPHVGARDGREAG